MIQEITMTVVSTAPLSTLVPGDTFDWLTEGTHLVATPNTGVTPPASGNVYCVRLTDGLLRELAGITSVSPRDYKAVAQA